jgi:quinol monooxygenase YgiN
MVDIDKIVDHVQTKEPGTLQYQIVKNSDKPNEVIVFEEVCFRFCNNGLD